MAGSVVTGVTGLGSYVPRLLLHWSPTSPSGRHMRVTGTLAFVDVSGFTRLTERLARKGRVGAEEMSDILSATFSALLDDAMNDGADLVKWGGDAILLLFRTPDHAERAARAAYRMRATMRRVGRIPTSSGTVVLRMSVGVHSGDFDFFLVGDPEVHRELLISGPGASETAVVEGAAEAGQIGLSAATAALLPESLLGGPLLEDGRLLRAAPYLTDLAGSVPEQFRGIAPAAALPPPIRELLAGGAVEPAHRAIAVGFVQFSGVDDLLVSEGPEALAAALDAVVRNVQHACAAHDVTFFETDINRDGGKIMLVAGAPRSADRHEERLLRVARQVIDRAGRLPLRIGVNRGHVFSGDFGPAFRRTYSVKGDAINLAARVMGKALPGQVLATDDALERSQTAFERTPLEPFLVKGKSEPVHASAVGEMLGTREHEHAAPLVGRTSELAALREAAAAVAAGQGRLVELVGPAGIGKTRLVEELVGETELPVLVLRCEEYESSTPYFPWRRLLREVLDVDSHATPAEVAEALAATVGARAPHLLAMLPLLAVPLDVPVASTPQTDELDETFRKDRLERSVADLLATLLPGPTVVVVEDAHDLDDASADLLHRIEATLSQRPWFLLVTRRPTDVGFAARAGEIVTTIEPQLLGEEESRELVQGALGISLTPAVLAELAQRGGGHPMFLEALAQGAGRGGALEELPESVEGLVTREIDRLPAADRRLLRCASVLGAVVDESLLAALVGDEGGDVRRLGDFLARERRGGRLRFRNALLRDVAYEGLPFRRRRTLHQRVGGLLEERATDAESQCELLSLHYFHAGVADKAWRYSVQAGHRAVAKYAHGEAVDFFERAARSVPRDGSVAPAEVGAVHEQLADSRFLVGLPEEATEAYAAARRCLRGDPVRLAGIIEKEARIDHRRRKFSVAMGRLSRGLRGLEGVTDREAGIARSLLARRYAFAKYSQGRVDEALAWAETAARHAEESVDKDALAQAYEVLGAIHAGSGRPEPLPYGRLALMAYAELGNLPRQGHCLNNLAVAAFTSGRWNDALADYRQAASIFHRIGDTASEGNALYNQAELLVLQGRLDEAGSLLPDVIQIARAVEDDELVALALRELAQSVARDDAARSVSLLEEAQEAFETLEEPDEVAATRVVLAEVLLGVGRTDRAAEVLATTPEEQLDGVAARVERLRGRLAVRAEEPVAAREHFLLGLEHAEGESNRYEQALLLRELTDLAGTSDDAAWAPVLDAMGVVLRP